MMARLPNDLLNSLSRDTPHWYKEEMRNIQEKEEKKEEYIIQLSNYEKKGNDLISIKSLPFTGIKEIDDNMYHSYSYTKNIINNVIILSKELLPLKNLECTWHNDYGIHKCYNTKNKYINKSCRIIKNNIQDYIKINNSDIWYIRYQGGIILLKNIKSKVALEYLNFDFNFLDNIVIKPKLDNIEEDIDKLMNN